MSILSEDDFLGIVINDVKDEAKRISEFAYKGIVDRTPAMTGQTRASWNMSEDVPDITTVDVGGEAGSPIPSPEVPNLQLVGDYPEIHIVNGKPHVEYLENGSPTTEPSAMVATTIASLS